MTVTPDWALALQQVSGHVVDPTQLRDYTGDMREGTIEDIHAQGSTPDHPCYCAGSRKLLELFIDRYEHVVTFASRGYGLRFDGISERFIVNGEVQQALDELRSPVGLTIRAKAPPVTNRLSNDDGEGRVRKSVAKPQGPTPQRGNRSRSAIERHRTVKSEAARLQRLEELRRT